MSQISQETLAWILGGISLFILLLLLLLKILTSSTSTTKSTSPPLTHALITGGSSGIGLSIAKELVRRKCLHISLLARGMEKLNKAREELESYAQSISSPTLVSIHSVDVGNYDAVQTLAKQIFTSDQKTTPPLSIIFNIAGTSMSGTFLDTHPHEFQRLMTINYMGCVNTTKAFLPYLQAHVRDQPDKQGRIVLTSSVAGQVGVYGYSAYSPTKFALTGLAQVLQMELERENIHVQLAFPPDTDTPGYKEEQVGKPQETDLISEAAGLFKPEDVAKRMVSSAIQPNPPFHVYFGLEGWMVSTLTAGMGPVRTMVDALCQILLMGILRFVSLFYLMEFRRIVRRVGRTRKEEAKEE